MSHTTVNGESVVMAPINYAGKTRMVSAYVRTGHDKNGGVDLVHINKVTIPRPAGSDGKPRTPITMDPAYLRQKDRDSIAALVFNS